MRLYGNYHVMLNKKNKNKLSYKKKNPYILRIQTKNEILHFQFIPYPEDIQIAFLLRMPHMCVYIILLTLECGVASIGRHVKNELTFGVVPTKKTIRLVLKAKPEFYFLFSRWKKCK